MLITGDKNTAHQQRITGRRIATVLSTSHWPSVRAQQKLVVDAVEAAIAGAMRK